MLFRRTLASEFRESLFGCLWNFADPIIIALAFLLLRHGGLIDPESLPIPFGAYVMYGMLILQLFIESLVQSVTILRRSKALVSNTSIPAEALIMADLLRLGFDITCQIPVLLIASMATGAFDAPGFLLYIALCPTIVALGYGLGLMAATLNMVVRDLEMFIRNLSRPLIFLCPTFYRAPSSDSFLGWLDAWNPIAILMNNLRLLATLGRWDSPIRFAVTAAGAVVLLLASAFVFHVTMRLVVERT